MKEEEGKKKKKEPENSKRSSKEKVGGTYKEKEVYFALKATPIEA